MNLDSVIAAAATSIGRTSARSVRADLQALEAEYQRRLGDDIARARAGAFIDSLDLEPAAYELAEQHEQQGNLRSAARWYRVAARGDHAHAALRLGVVLELLAGRAAHHGPNSSYSSQRDELFLVREAAHAYSEAYAAGCPEAAEKLDDMFAEVEQRRNRTTNGPCEVPGRSDRECSYVHDRSAAHSVLGDADITRLSQHAARCVPCLKALIARTMKDALTVPGAVTFVNEPEQQPCGAAADTGAPAATALHFSGVGR